MVGEGPGAEGWRSPAKVRNYGGPCRRPPNQDSPRPAKPSPHTHKTPSHFPTPRKLQYRGIERESEEENALLPPYKWKVATAGLTKLPPVYIRTSPLENVVASFLSPKRWSSPNFALS